MTNDLLARFARASRASRPTPENTGPRDGTKTHDAFPHGALARTVYPRLGSSTRTNHRRSRTWTTSFFTTEESLVERARAMAPSRDSHDLFPRRFARPIALRTAGAGGSVPSVVQSQVSATPAIATRTSLLDSGASAGGEGRRTAANTFWRARSESPRTRSGVRLDPNGLARR